MENKKEIYRAGLMIGVLTFLVNIITLPIETMLLGLVSLLLNLCNRKHYRVKTGIVFTLVGMGISLAYILFAVYKMKFTGANYDNYWFFRMLKVSC